MGLFSGVDEVLNSAKQGNFEEVLTKTRIYAEDAAKKSAERLEISKKKIELLDSKTKLVKAYEHYGKLQYAIYEGEQVDQDELRACVEEIQLQKSRADLLDAEIEEMKAVFIEPLSKREAKQYEKAARRNERRNDTGNKENDIEVTVAGSDE
ncbi:MAG: hypothetical protein ACLUFN_11050 [Eubacterium sp.]